MMDVSMMQSMSIGKSFRQAADALDKKMTNVEEHTHKRTGRSDLSMDTEILDSVSEKQLADIISGSDKKEPHASLQLIIGLSAALLADPQVSAGAMSSILRAKVLLTEAAGVSRTKYAENMTECARLDSGRTILA